MRRRIRFRPLLRGKWAEAGGNGRRQKGGEGSKEGGGGGAEITFVFTSNLARFFFEGEGGRGRGLGRGKKRNNKFHIVQNLN